MPCARTPHVYNLTMYPQDKPLPSPFELASGVAFSATTDYSKIYGHRWIITNQAGAIISITSCRGNFNRAWSRLTGA